MSDTPGNGGGENQKQQAPLTINGQYIKDLSFEAPNSPVILTELKNHQPDIKVTVNVSTSKLEGPNAPANLHEVVLELQSELKVGDKIGFLIELKYGGVFTLNVPKEHEAAFLMIECPRMLFPFARQIVADTSQAGGFMPLMLQPLDFAAMYQANAQNQANDLGAEVDKMVADKDAH